METPDYNYYTHPDLIKKVLDGLGGHEGVLLFCQQNGVQVAMGSDYSYGAYINSQDCTWSTDIDCYSALLFGIANYKKHHNLP